MWKTLPYFIWCNYVHAESDEILQKSYHVPFISMLSSNFCWPGSYDSPNKAFYELQSYATHSLCHAHLFVLDSINHIILEGWQIAPWNDRMSVEDELRIVLWFLYFEILSFPLLLCFWLLALQRSVWRRYSGLCDGVTVFCLAALQCFPFVSQLWRQEFCRL